MNPIRWLLLAVLMLAALPARAAEPGPVVVVPVRSEISAAQFFFLRRALKEAERDGASAFILDMETPGGSVSAANDNMDALLKTGVPTYTYVNSRALSAGALIALATQQIYMAPTAVIGAAAPVLATGDDAPKTMTDKTVSAMSAMARAAAQKNGHNPDLADAFIAKEREVKIGDVVIDRPDSLLTLSAQEAVKEYEGKPLLAKGVANSIEDLVKQAGLSADIRYVEPTGFERVAIWITMLAPLLLLGGIAGAYIEFKTPGFGIPGTISIVCFTLFFTGHYIAGLSGHEVMIFFAIGLALVISELFIHPGTILPGVAGVLLMLGALVWAMVDHWPNQPVVPSADLLLRPLLNLSLAIIAAVFVIYLLAKVLPATPFYHQIVLAADTPAGPGVSIPVERVRVASGAIGQTRTQLRPAGKAIFGDEVMDVVSQGDFIDANVTVHVVSADGTRVMVAPVHAAAPASPAQG
jgi:membrane-bound serine protease (ClpP class)